MTTSASKRLIIALSIATALLAGLAAWGWARTFMHEFHATLADNWSQMLEESRDSALASTNVANIAAELRWLGRFHRSEQFPSGIEGRHLSLIERARVAYQRDIVLHLRQLTGDQLGNDPKLWVQKYAKPEK